MHDFHLSLNFLLKEKMPIHSMSCIINDLISQATSEAHLTEPHHKLLVYHNSALLVQPGEERRYQKYQHSFGKFNC